MIQNCYCLCFFLAVIRILSIPTKIIQCHLRHLFQQWDNSCLRPPFLLRLNAKTRSAKPLILVKHPSLSKTDSLNTAEPVLTLQCLTANKLLVTPLTWKTSTFWTASLVGLRGESESPSTRARSPQYST